MSSIIIDRRGRILCTNLWFGLYSTQYVNVCNTESLSVFISLNFGYGKDSTFILPAIISLKGLSRCVHSIYSLQVSRENSNQTFQIRYVTFGAERHLQHHQNELKRWFKHGIAGTKSVIIKVTKKRNNKRARSVDIAWLRLPLSIKWHENCFISKIQSTCTEGYISG